jgi:hypothetical protein
LDSSHRAVPADKIGQLAALPACRTSNRMWPVSRQ